ncbi:MAG: DUF6152 family protein, partial [Rhodospirillaceae bacterium]|nr:DUF6152 family protein [Rhodospirillaceae bacterium]
MQSKKFRPTHRFHPWAVAAAVACMTVPALAHHSHGKLVLSVYRQLTGTVTQLHWINPHTWIY